MRHNEKWVESIVICPKCKSKDLFLKEIWINNSIDWEQLDGKFDRNDGNLEHGYPHALEADCKKCNHRWKIRGKKQIYEIIKD